MKRIHIHVSVQDLNESVRFYSALFGNVAPTTRKPDYCKWELSDPAVNFAISQRGAPFGVDHVGIQVENAEELAEMNARFASARLPVQIQEDTTCCYARSEKAWTLDPQGVAWETFHTLEAAPVYGQSRNRSAEAAACCSLPKPSSPSIQQGLPADHDACAPVVEPATPYAGSHSDRDARNRRLTCPGRT
jgi:Glyoxalase/Bleomycin resistance protein/Dioxygenase superfamily